MIRYFIAPSESHSCGIFLLLKLFEVLELDLPVDEHCIVPDKEQDHIDILIQRDSPNSGEPNYAVIIENKVNSAKDQKKQLMRYPESVKNIGASEKIEQGRIEVFYLPRTDEKQPSPDSVGDQKFKVIKRSIITFWFGCRTLSPMCSRGRTACKMAWRTT